VTGAWEVPDALREQHERGEIGGRTVQITEAGEVECARYEPAPLADGRVRIRTVRSAVSSGTELTYYGRAASNVKLHKHWNEALRLFEAGRPGIPYPVTLGYRAAGEVVASEHPDAPVGLRVYGKWRHTELTSMPAAQAAQQRLADGLSWDDGVDVAHMGPIGVNAVAFAEGAHVGHPAVVFGAGVVGLITAQIARADGADPVHVVDRLPGRLDIARSLGLDVLDPASVDDISAALKMRHGPEAIPIAWECTGSPLALHESIRTVRRRGAVIAVGFYQGEAAGLFLGDEFHHNGVRLIAGMIGNLHQSQSWPSLQRRTIDLALAGPLRLGGLPRLTVPVEEVARGFEALARPAEVLQVALAYD